MPTYLINNTDINKLLLHIILGANKNAFRQAQGEHAFSFAPSIVCADVEMFKQGEKKSYG